MGANGRLSEAVGAPPVEDGCGARTPQNGEATLFHTYNASIELIRKLGPLISVIQRKDRNLADPIRRAATSVALNLAEGNQRTGRDKTYRFRIAAGSAKETWAGLEIAEAWGYLTVPGETSEILDRIGAMLWRLTHPLPE